jgi:hypothetical protein
MTRKETINLIIFAICIGLISLFLGAFVSLTAQVIFMPVAFVLAWLYAIHVICGDDE